MSNIDKHALREAAEKAQAARARLESIPDEDVVLFEENDIKSDVSVCNKFIVTANPSTVLALLDELEAGEQQIKTLESRNRRLDGIIAAAEKRIAELQELRKTDSADREMLKRLYDECDTGERRGNGSQSGVAMPSWVTVEAARLLLGVK